MVTTKETQFIFYKRECDVMGRHVVRIPRGANLALWVAENGYLENRFELVKITQTLQEVKRQQAADKSVNFDKNIEVLNHYRRLRYTHVLMYEQYDNTYVMKSFYGPASKIVLAGDYSKYFLMSDEQLKDIAFLKELPESKLFARFNCPYEAKEVVEILRTKGKLSLIHI